MIQMYLYLAVYSRIPSSCPFRALSLSLSVSSFCSYPKKWAFFWEFQFHHSSQRLQLLFKEDSVIFLAIDISVYGRMLLSYLLKSNTHFEINPFSNTNDIYVKSSQPKNPVQVKWKTCNWKHGKCWFVHVCVFVYENLTIRAHLWLWFVLDVSSRHVQSHYLYIVTCMWFIRLLWVAISPHWKIRVCSCFVLLVCPFWFSILRMYVIIHLSMCVWTESLTP